MSGLIMLLVLFAVGVIIGILLRRKDNEIKKLRNEKEGLIRGINMSSIIIRKSNIMGVAPKDLPEDFDK